MLIAAVILADRKLYTWQPCLGAVLTEGLVDRVYLNIQTLDPAQYASLAADVSASVKPCDIDFWQLRSSWLADPVFDQDQSRVAPICIARNMALDYAFAMRGDYLLFVDSDVVIHRGGLAKLLEWDKPISGGYVPGRGAHREAHYLFGERDRSGAMVRCAHGTAGYMLIKQEVFERVRFRRGPHIKAGTWVSEDPNYVGDAEALGLADGWYVHLEATADHLDDTTSPLTLAEAINSYRAME